MATAFNQAQVERLKNKIYEEIDKKHEKIATMLYKKLIDSNITPVQTGTLRYNWNMQYNEADDEAADKPSSEEPNYYPKPFVPELEGSVKNGDTQIWVSNYTPYARAVNDGTDKFAARDMTGKALKALRTELEIEGL